MGRREIVAVEFIKICNIVFFGQEDGGAHGHGHCIIVWRPNNSDFHVQRFHCPSFWHDTLSRFWRHAGATLHLVDFGTYAVRYENRLRADRSWGSNSPCGTGMTRGRSSPAPNREVSPPPPPR